jgi:putative transposase
MHDTLYGGRRFRTLNVIDEGNREGLAIEIGTSIPSARVVRVM